MRDDETVDATATDLVSVFRNYSRYVASIALRLLGRDDDVDDVVQEVFLIAMRGLDSVRDPAAIRGWLATITVRVARRKMRRRRLWAFVGLDAAPDHARLVVDAAQDKAVLIVRAYSALEHMPVDDKIAWMFRYVEGEPLESVAKICGCSLATAKRRIARAQAALALEVDE
ncbi:MAG TPA: RNA polymerase sigma factor [Kofleriaceae bacterium]|nr:RNA polymerase sigma factor [Kofleriaceae bacterium]